MDGDSVTPSRRRNRIARSARSRVLGQDASAAPIGQAGPVTTPLAYASGAAGAALLVRAAPQKGREPAAADQNAAQAVAASAPGQSGHTASTAALAPEEMLCPPAAAGPHAVARPRAKPPVKPLREASRFAGLSCRGWVLVGMTAFSLIAWYAVFQAGAAVIEALTRQAGPMLGDLAQPPRP